MANSSVSLTTVIALYEAGYSLRQVGAKVGRSHTAIMFRLQRAGITLRGPKESTVLDPRRQRAALWGRSTKELCDDE